MNDPFEYIPHPLCKAASEEVRRYALGNKEWIEELKRGKMFGVLTVELPPFKNPFIHVIDERTGYLAAFSGQINGSGIANGFVPPIFNVDNSVYFQKEMHEIESLTAKHDEKRRMRSEALQDWLFRQYECVNALGERKNIVDIFKEFYLRNMLKQENYERNSSKHHIPSGTGECCAPKLLQYACLNDLKPLHIAEFWVQRQYRDITYTDGGIRHDRQFYPACNKKCRPLLDFITRGLNIEKSPSRIENEQMLSKVGLIYEDDHIIVVDKPSGLLSVPGRNGQKSLADWMHEYKHIDDFWFVHRLDQDTRGLLIIAKDESTYKDLQQQFIKHTICKTYEALLDGHVEGDEGNIKLRMRPDPDDPPRQMVDMTHGKNAVTRWKVLKRQGETTHVELYPDTGRTHQLRVHCAHVSGLNSPIHGDRLYGRYNPSPTSKLCLAATRISATIDGKSMTFSLPSDKWLWENVETPPFEKTAKN